MSNYNTGNPVPSTDPRDLDDNATVFDQLMNSTEASVPDRLGVPRKTYRQMEQDALDVTNPNLVALSGLTGAADRLAYFTGVGAMAITTLTPIARTLLDDTTTAAMLTTLGAAPIASPTFTGTAAAPTPAVGTNTTQIATAAMIQAEIANKRAWTSYTPTVTPNTGTFTSASAQARYLVLFGVCHVQIVLTVATKGTGTYPTVSLPFTALTGSANHVLPCGESVLNFKMGQAKIDVAHTGLSIAAYDGGDLVSGNGVVINIQGSYPIA